VPIPLPLYSVLPFVAMLLASALLPLALPPWWESNRNKLLVSAGLSLPVLLLYLAQAPRVLAHTAGDSASFMLVIRALLQTNQEREHVTHTVVFFIFLVSNIGGMLTPLGDPPLFLGYLAGVPFSWTLRLWAPWLAMLLSLLALYFGWDTIQHRRETPAARRRDHALVEPLRLHGGLNALWLAGVVAVRWWRWRSSSSASSSP
jgi:Na+/H+ antiporter NhaD/arsenite permease-like protein